MGYHVKNIIKGVFGEPSKIQEELDELNDALEQGNRIMALVELSDLYGALEAVASANGTNMEELKVMSMSTKKAFLDGTRKSEESPKKKIPKIGSNGRIIYDK